LHATLIYYDYNRINHRILNVILPAAE